MAERAHERSEAPAKARGNVASWPVFKIGAAWLAFLFVALSGLALFYYQLGGTAHPPNPALFPHPQLVTHPNRENANLVDAQKRALKQYGWVDRARGIAHIPIEKAMAADLKRPDPYAPIGDKGGGTP
jgi:hypothetical protein